MLRPWFYFSWIHPKASGAVDGFECRFVQLHSVWYPPLSPSPRVALRLDLLLPWSDRLGHTLKKFQVTNMNQVIFPGSNLAQISRFTLKPCKVWGVWVRCNHPTCGVSLIPASSGTPRTQLAFDLPTMVFEANSPCRQKEPAFPCSVFYRTQ